MKKILLLAALCAAIFFTGCQSAPPAAAQGDVSFDDVIGKEWKLVDVLIDGRTIGFSRDILATEGFRDAFTLEFDAERLSGAAAPNRYFAPYTLGQGNAVSIGAVAQTQMAALFEPEQLREHDYLFFVQSTYRWNLADGRLELSSRGRNDEAVTLIFQQ